MTRAEFAAEVEQYFSSWAGGLTVMEYLNDLRKTHTIYGSIADVATNGFDPEPADGPMVILRGDDANAFAQRAIEQSQQAAKRSRPFVGSHKLPVDLDWD